MRNANLAVNLHQLFLHCPQYAKLLSRTARGSNTELNLVGLTDSAKSLVLSVLAHETKRPMMIVVQDNHIGARYHQELSNLSRYPIYLFPSSEVSPYEQVLSSPDNIAAQLEVLTHCLERPNDPFIAVVSARALTQRVLSPKSLTDNTLTFSVGQNIDPAELARRMANLGYSREALVTLRGEFSIRGDIVDIFPSFGPPVRIELFGEEIESIRVFNIDSQRSVETKDKCLIPPRWWITLHKDDAEREAFVETLRAVTDKTVQELPDQAADTMRSVMESDLEALAAGRYPESVEYYAPYVHSEFATICDYITDSSLIVLDEWDSLFAAIQSYEERLNGVFKEGLDTGRLLPLPRSLHASGRETAAALKKHQRVFVSTLPIALEEETLSSELAAQALVHFECQPVERFGNQIDLLAEKVRGWRKEGLHVLISTEQPQRILGILKEWDIGAEYLSGADTSQDTHIDLNGTADGAGNGAGNGNNSGNGAAKNPGAAIGPGSAAKDKEAKDKDLAARLADLEGALPAPSARGASSSGPPVWVCRHGFTHGFRLNDAELVCVTDAEMFGLKRKPTVYRRPIAEKSYERFTSVADLKMGDYVVHMKHGIGQFVGVQRITVDAQMREYLTVQYTGDDRLYVPVDQINLLSRYRGAGDTAPRLSRLGGAEWESTKRRVKKSVKQVAEDLVNLYAMRAKQEGFQCVPDTPWQYEMEEAFPFEETPDQWQAILDVKADLESSKPADRLICGDVGFGKTEVAIRGIFKAVMSGKQVAVLVPTTILAQQHYNNMSERFAAYPIKVGLLSRFRTAKEQREVARRLSTGECDVVVGTHRMLQKDIAFKDLGLVVIDEEQRFGVAHKEKLKQLRVMVDVITMSATPIPRTLYMALSGARDMSQINTAPINRSPIKTFVGEYKLPLVRTAILHEMERGGQIYFVHNRVENIEQIAYEVKQLVPEARIAIGHGQMNERDLENVMLSFFNHEFDVLVCTTIIESGLDITNVNTIIINDADKLGLAQMYQLRGRVGRSACQAYAYCLYTPAKILSEQAQGRLKAIREFTSLGSGYQIALRDMEIRGVGNILGSEQHGHMISVGFELYCKLLEESVAELKGEIVEQEAEAAVDINVTAYIPESYIEDGSQRLIEYKRLADVKSATELSVLVDEWKDRFGQIPKETEQLTKVVRLRLLASHANVQSIKPDLAGVRLYVPFRLQQWLPVQNRLPKHLANRTVYKPGIAGGQGSSPYILVKSQGDEPEDQLTLLEELLTAIVSNSQVKQA
ncbi:MAG: transcription-repair coupling factor [Cyanobacteria bacterium REEB67]|nr:transcription-repair coupling factor [Cyanobacteria bacterium REEB67]